MRLLLAVLLTALLSFIAGLFLPWWSIAPIAFLVALLLGLGVGRSFLAGFLGENELHLVAEMYFESEESFKAALQSPEWATSGANLAEIGGMELVAMFSAEVVA